MTWGADDLGRAVRRDGIVCCTVGGEQYALRSGDVRHIERAEEMRPETDASGRVGTIQVGDESVPVFALGRVLRRRVRSDAASGHHIAVTGDRGALVGWLVDRIVRMPIPEASAVVALPAVIGAPACHWFEALIGGSDESILLVSPAALNPLAPPIEPEAAGRVFLSAAPAAAAGAAPEPMVVVFSTPALPASEVSRYALSGRQIAAIVQPLPLIELPGTARHVPGVAWWRQSIVPVVDYRPAGAGAPCPRWIIAQAGHRPGETLLALPIGADVRLHRASADDRPLVDVLRPGFTRGVYGVNGEAVALLDLEAILAMGERVDALT